MPKENKTRNIWDNMLAEMVAKEVGRRQTDYRYPADPLLNADYANRTLVNAIQDGFLGAAQEYSDGGNTDGALRILRMMRDPKEKPVRIFEK